MSTPKTTRGWRSRIAAAGAVLALTAVPLAATTIAPPAQAQAEVCGAYHGALLSVGGCDGPGVYAPLAYGTPVVAPPPPAPVFAPPPPGRVCGGYHGIFISAGGCN